MSQPSTSAGTSGAHTESTNQVEQKIKEKPKDKMPVMKLEVQADSTTDHMEPIPEEDFEIPLLAIEEKDQCEYKRQIWQNMLIQESKKQAVLLHSTQLAYRGSLVNQLRHACRKLGLNICTLHAAVAHLDLYMDKCEHSIDTLEHLTLACLSLAVKSEEKFDKAPLLKALSAVSRVKLCPKKFKMLEWKVAEKLDWKLLTPTPVTFASLIAHCVVADVDLTSKNSNLAKKLRHHGAKLLEVYLDLTLSDVRLKVMNSANLACACVACTRTDLDLIMWPQWLAAITGKKPNTIMPIARLLQRMMQALRARGEFDEVNCRILFPMGMPLTEPKQQIPYIPVAFTSRSNDVEPAQSQDDLAAFYTSSAAHVFEEPNFIRLCSPVDLSMQKANSSADYGYCGVDRMQFEPQPSTSRGVKRSMDTIAETEAKRYRLTKQMSQKTYPDGAEKQPGGEQAQEDRV